MKVFFCLILIFLSFAAYSQTDSSLVNFINLVDKIQHDKSLYGAFTYKGYEVSIHESEDYKTAIGKVIEIEWKYNADNRLHYYKAIFHNTLGYMTREIFDRYKYSLKEYKVDKSKYNKGGFYYELKTDSKLPYILMYYGNISELKEIK